MTLAKERNRRRNASMSARQYDCAAFNIGAHVGLSGWKTFRVPEKQSRILEKQRRRVWKDLGAAAIAWHVAYEPGTRPKGFWLFDYKGRMRRPGENYYDFIADVLDFSEYDEVERDAAEDFRDDEQDYLFTTHHEPVDGGLRPRDWSC